MTVEELGGRMSAQEFGEWFVYMSREQLHPEIERIRHAQLRADIRSGPSTPAFRQGGWEYTDFVDLDAWAPEPEPTDMPSLRDQVETLNRLIIQ